MTDDDVHIDRYTDIHVDFAAVATRFAAAQHSTQTRHKRLAYVGHSPHECPSSLPYLHVKNC